MSSTRLSLRSAFASALPYGLKLDFYHISTPPTLCSALFAPPAAHKPVRTYCESHFLTVTYDVSANPVQHQLAIFAIEIFVYTSEALTTIYVSKADSTGFIHLIPEARASPSILRAVTSSFISVLVNTRHRPDRKLVVSLFARAQDQYLFPGSIEHGKKHVLDDRGLVKWWCKTLDPILQAQPHDHQQPNINDIDITSKAYLMVPGCDKHETAAFLPSSVVNDNDDGFRWICGHPLRSITSYPTAAPRSMIPHFPDDPKSRFVLDLDEELTSASTSELQNRKSPSPSKRGDGQWKSIKSLEQFWEMMAYRQECSSGRLVGFLWAMFSPHPLGGEETAEDPDSPSLRPAKRKLVTSRGPGKGSAQARPVKRKQHVMLRGPIISKSPQIKSRASTQRSHTLREMSKHWYWPVCTRGCFVLEEKAYTRVTELLLRLDFASVDVACLSTQKWIRETSQIANGDVRWGMRVTGAAKSMNAATKTVSMENDAHTCHGVARHVAGEGPSLAVNILTSNAIRKKPKLEEPMGRNSSICTHNEVTQRGVRSALNTTVTYTRIANTLDGTAIRKKPK